jgi:ABC-type dipeptide/oligopeptide/nickel transport system ATPase component
MNFPRVIYKREPKKDSWCRWAVYRIRRRNNSTNIRLTGDGGSGKSWSALYIAETCAELLGYKISKENIYFSITDIINRVSREEPKPGTIFFLDEQQIGASSKEHNTVRGEAYTAFMSTVRSKRYIFISTLPFADMTIKKVRRFFHLEVETQGIDFANKTVRTKPRMLDHSKTRDKVYRKRLLIVYNDPQTGLTRAKKLDTWDIAKPSDEIIAIYEEMKQDFQRRLYKSLAHKLEKYENRDNVDEVPKAVASDIVENTLTDYQKAIMRLMREGVKRQKDISYKLKAEGFTSTPPKVSQNIKWMRKKGVVILR